MVPLKADIRGSSWNGDSRATLVNLGYGPAKDQRIKRGESGRAASIEARTPPTRTRASIHCFILALRVCTLYYSMTGYAGPWPL
jgi:hypothetical protein